MEYMEEEEEEEEERYALPRAYRGKSLYLADCEAWYKETMPEEWAREKLIFEAKMAERALNVENNDSTLEPQENNNDSTLDSTLDQKMADRVAAWELATNGINNNNNV